MHWAGLRWACLLCVAGLRWLGYDGLEWAWLALRCCSALGWARLGWAEGAQGRAALGLARVRCAGLG